MQNDPNSWLAQLRFSYAALNNSWNQWVLDYNPERQRCFLEELGAAFANWRSALGAALVCGLLYGLRWRRQRRPADPLDGLYHAFCRQQARHGYARSADEGPLAYAARLRAMPASAEKTRGHGTIFIPVRYAEVQRGRGRTTIIVAHDLENTATSMPMKTLISALLLGAATLAQAAAVDPYGYKLPPSMQPKKKPAVVKKKGPPPVDYVGEFVNFGEWKDVRAFLDDVAARDGFDRAALDTLMGQVRYVDSAVQLVKPAPRASRRTGKRTAG